MGRLALCVLALFVASGVSTPGKKWQKTVDRTNLEHQQQLLLLFLHPHEPIHVQELRDIVTSWDLEKNIGLYNNATAVHLTVRLLQNNDFLPKSMPFTILEPFHKFEVSVYYNLLYSAKTYDTFYKTAVYLREHVNENLFVYVLSVAILHRPDTQDIRIPPIYDILPSYFQNGEIMTTAQRITTHGSRMVEHYPSTYIWDNNVVIRLNETAWPYFHLDSLPVSYFTHDPTLNALYYNVKLAYPIWLRSESSSIREKRGEVFYFFTKQILARYYMERLSVGLGEIPVLGVHEVEEGYTSGLLHHNGIPYPVRPNHFVLNHQTWHSEAIEEIEIYENRIREAIDQGYYITSTGEHVSITSPDSIDVLGRLIEANVDSPNIRYYKDFISIWRKVLGNSIVHEPVYRNGVPLVVPSVLEQYQTALRDPAYYMILQRVLNLFELWHAQLPYYTTEELLVPSVQIQNVEVDKLLTYFEYTYLNVSNHLHLNEIESQNVHNTKSVLVQRTRLNHKVYTVRVNVKSDVAKHVTVRFFLAPKYDSLGHEIPLHINSQNFLLIDIFDYELKAGDNLITRLSTDNLLVTDDYDSVSDLINNVDSALHGQGQYILNLKQNILKCPRNLLIPKGRVSGMPFVLMVYISEYHAPNDVQRSSIESSTIDGTIRLTSDPLGFPVDRPLRPWMLTGVNNIYFEDVQIFHKPSTEVSGVTMHVE
ncbi:acidic juvenile hormone-suppressible protein 1-like [Achroia grisella]|uniref:acidic juvenile hormone-suppressible protein 1-like n=1 Tax=Achroia grisella TaxID=688607 RepID=UPI0027D2CAA3|nr:acidic juvenile hormone-suppressible protein 1-like [Achroia grisella]